MSDRVLGRDRRLHLVRLGDARHRAQVAELVLAPLRAPRLGGLDRRPRLGRVLGVVLAAEDPVEKR